MKQSGDVAVVAVVAAVVVDDDDDAGRRVVFLPGVFGFFSGSRSLDCALARSGDRAIDLSSLG